MSQMQTCNYYDSSEDSPQRTVLVLGSSGALGSSLTHHFTRNLGMNVVGADVMELPSDLQGSGFELAGFIGLDPNADLTKLTVDLVDGADHCLNEIEQGCKFDAIVCANGGWMGDPPAVVPDPLEDDWRQHLREGATDYANTITHIIDVNLNPVLAAQYIAQHYMNPGSLMVVMGATAALSPTPGMLGYGIAKAATHHMIQTVGASTGPSLETKSVRKAGRKVRQHLPTLDNLSVVGILPTMLDTEANRKANPKGNFEQWTRPSHVAKAIGTWIETPPLRPHSGSLVKVYPKDGEATFELAR